MVWQGRRTQPYWTYGKDENAAKAQNKRFLATSSTLMWYRKGDVLTLTDAGGNTVSVEVKAVDKNEVNRYGQPVAGPGAVTAIRATAGLVNLTEGTYSAAGGHGAGAALTLRALFPGEATNTPVAGTFALDAAGQFYARGDKLTIEKGGHKAVITVQETTPIEYGSEG
ncbi:MAG: hypothetical protein LBR44_00560, partial [Clostridiales Family XIII bacterium]|nr:hypothetical protein [Clostridiales Family XIII bacterium]